MTAYHQMGHNSRNLLDEVTGFRGAIVSPINEILSDVAAMVARHRSEAFEFVFDPQLYFPKRSDRGQLGQWSYFPKDIDTADMSSAAWWDRVLGPIRDTVLELNVDAVCAPAVLNASTFTNGYYESMRLNADRLAPLVHPKGVRVLQTLIVKMADLAEPARSMEIASVASNTKADGIYLVFCSDLKPRDEFRDVDQLKGAMRLINALEEAGLPVIVACASSDVVLWKAAGASAVATGKFANLRRFTVGRFNDQEDGGRQVAYWMEESLLAFVRQSDIIRLQPHGLAGPGTNPFAGQILGQIATEPAEPWVALGWRQYMHWFADIERRLPAGASKELVRTAESNWALLEENDVFLDEPSNNGKWLRPWLQAIAEFKK